MASSYKPTPTIVEAAQALYRGHDVREISRSEAGPEYPHLTMSVLSHELEATLTIPHAVNRTVRRKLISLGEHGFQRLIRDVVKNLKPLLRRCPGATPLFRGLQRRVKSSCNQILNRLWEAESGNRSDQPKQGAHSR